MKYAKLKARQGQWWVSRSSYISNNHNLGQWECNGSGMGVPPQLPQRAKAKSPSIEVRITPKTYRKQH